MCGRISCHLIVWLNEVELRFSKIERDLLARGIFTSVADWLARFVDISIATTASRSRSRAYRNPARRIGSTSSEDGALDAMGAVMVHDDEEKRRKDDVKNDRDRITPQ